MDLFRRPWWSRRHQERVEEADRKHVRKRAEEKPRTLGDLIKKHMEGRN